MITPDKIQQIKTAYSWLRPSPIFDLVETVEELQKEIEVLRTEKFSLQQQLMIEGHEEDCACVQVASVDCSCGVRLSE